MASWLIANMHKIYLLFVLVLASPPAFAQERAGCFLRDSQGKAVDLGNLCPEQSKLKVQSKVYGKNIIIPIKRRVSGIPIIEVVFNGRHRYEMAFDTGASLIAITPEMAKRLGIKVERKAIFGTANGNVVANIGTVNSIKVGNVIQKDLPVVIPAGLTIGLLGQNFFGEHDVTIRANEIIINKRP
jgi:aspartyl protease family protein